MAKIEIFSGPQCGYCKQAKEILDQKGLSYQDLDISDQQHRTELMRRLPRTRSIPQIFVDGEHIGGFEDLQTLDADSRLNKMLGSR
ncbi:MAG: glutaredoxin family protein [Gammaproteobacteria bacterium]|nr:glutaredoxin family protein [Gammaproteobacteria bacterium]